jgi:hypothetical protein
MKHFAIILFAYFSYLAYGFGQAPSVEIIAKWQKGEENATRLQIKDNALSLDTVLARKYVDFIIERDGSLLRNKQDGLQGMFEGFLKTENEWRPGIMSSRPARVQVEFILMHNYIMGKEPWDSNPKKITPPSGSYGNSLAPWAKTRYIMQLNSGVPAIFRGIPQSRSPYKILMYQWSMTLC